MSARARLLRFFLAAIASSSLVLFPLPSSAHPMGNFSISHYAGITIEGHFVELRYFIDMAEIPAFQQLQESGMEARVDDPRLASYLSGKAQAFERGLQLRLNDRPLAMRVVTQNVIFPPGAGNLPTMKFGFVYIAELEDDCSATPCRLEYQDTNFTDRAGWKEVVVTAGHGTNLLSSTMPERDRSSQLSNYPTDLLNSPPRDLQARVVFSSGIAEAAAPISIVAGSRKDPPASTHEGVSANGKPAIAPMSRPSFSAESHSSLEQPKLELKPNQQSTPRNRFTELIATKKITFGIALFAALIAAGLGALHALEPGHGKTIVAAYLVGSRGTARHALLLGMIVTISHTAGVYLLGAITLYAQKYILPDRIYPFLAVLSGMLIAGMGCYLFLQRYVGAEFAHKHSYEFSSDEQASSQTVQRQPGNVSVRQLLVLGTTGGIIPCPAALVVLLSATALHRTVFGLYLIVAFSIGLAAVLIAMGLVVVFAGNALSRWRLEGPLLQRWLPMASAAMIVLIGVGIAARGLVSAGVVQFRM